MCYPSYRQAVETEVLRRIAAQEMFTAWDITRAVQAQGFHQPHRVLKEVVHCLHRYGRMGGDYQRAVITVGDEGVQAFLYHHGEADPRTYGASGGGSNHFALARLVPQAKRGLLDALLGRARGNAALRP